LVGFLVQKRTRNLQKLSGPPSLLAIHPARNPAASDAIGSLSPTIWK
jgi:hypothetical protein